MTNTQREWEGKALEEFGDMRTSKFERLTAFIRTIEDKAEERGAQMQRERILYNGIQIKSLKRVDEKLWVELDAKHYELGDVLTVVNASRFPTKDKGEDVSSNNTV